MWIITCNR